MLKKLIIFSLIFGVNCTFARKVKFSVNMNGQTISPNGVHVSGDFQNEAGYPEDWDAAATAMIKEGNSQVYSVTVEIPAGYKYEYKFVNGDKFYEVEFVPEKSRVGFDFNDNRWIYVDKVNTDTLKLAALYFGGNAPAGMYMIRFKLDMQLQTNIANTRLFGNFNLWSLNHPVNSFEMYSFSDKVYEIMIYVDSIHQRYSFYNNSQAESVPAACGDKDLLRYADIKSDTILNEVCFASCTDCVAALDKQKSRTRFQLIPNPTNDKCVLNFNKGSIYSVSVKDISGRDVINYSDIGNTSLEINTSELIKGIYFISIMSADKSMSVIKMVVN